MVQISCACDVNTSSPGTSCMANCYVLSHRQLDVFQSLEDVSPLIKQASSGPTN